MESADSTMFDGDDTAGGVSAPGRTPPYIAFKTFLTLIEDLKTNGLPPQVDRSVLKRFSGGVGSQLQMGLRSLGLTDDKNRPTEDFRRLVETNDPEEFKILLKPTIERSYPFLEGLDLRTATPTMFADAFKKGLSAKEDVLRKCRTFYLHAAQHVGIEIGPRLLNASFPRPPNAGGVRRKARSKSTPAPTSESEVSQPASDSPRAPAPLRDPVGVLVSIIDMSKMDENEQDAVWTLIRYLKKQEAKAGGNS